MMKLKLRRRTENVPLDFIDVYGKGPFPDVSHCQKKNMVRMKILKGNRFDNHDDDSMMMTVS
jgi:hypothetical protein